MSDKEYKKAKWVVSGCSIAVEPGEQETLLEWKCPDNHAAILDSYIINNKTDFWKNKDFTVELAFQTLAPHHTDYKYVYHRNPNPWSRHQFQTAVQIRVTNHTSESIDMWATLKGEHTPTTKIASANPPPTPKSIPTVQKETVMNTDDLSNSHDDIPTGSMPTLGVHKAELPFYGEGDIAPLHMDNRGRLLIAVDGMTEEAEKQLARLTEREAALASEAAKQTAKQALKKQKVGQKYAIKCQEIQLKSGQSNADKDKELSKDEKHTKALISSYRYEFLSTLARWAAVAGSAITIAYLLA